MASLFKLFLGSQQQAAASGDAALAITGTATALFVGDFSDANRQPLSATGTATVAFVGAEIQSAAPVAATGTATVGFAGAGDQLVDAALATTGTGTASFVGVDATPVVVTPSALTGGGGVGTWSGFRKKRKKKEALDELDTLLAAVKAQIEPWETAKAYEAEQAIYRNALKSAAGVDMSSTLAKIESEVVNLKELLMERDEEETLMLLM